MLQNFDYFGSPEKPQILLTKANGSVVAELNYVGLSRKIRYNDVSEISFVIYQKDNDSYELVKGRKYITIDTHGIFIINDVKSTDDGNSSYKKVSCKSVDFELTYKRITLEPKAYKMYDVLNPSETLIGRVLQLIPSWSIDSVDLAVGSQYRYFDIEDKDLYSFLCSDVEDAFQCIFEFNYTNRKISVKGLGSVGTNTNIYLSFDNILNQIDVSELSDEVVTNLFAYGGNNLNIRSVNPTGSNGILNLDYFKTTEWMSQTLITAIDDYAVLYNSKKSQYESTLLQYKTANEEKDILEGQLAVLENEYKAIETLLKTQIQGGVSTTTTLSQLNTKASQINSKNNEITNKINQINSYITVLNGIVSSLSISNNFTSSEIIELDKHIICYTYQNDAYTITDSMTEAEKLEQAQLLYADAMLILSRLSQPRFSFTVSAVDFTKMLEFKNFTDKLALASKIYIEFDEDNVVESRLISYTHDWDTNSLSFEFTSKYRTNDSTYTYEELYKKSISAGISIGFERFQYKDWASNSKDLVTEFINSSLNASLNNLISSENQEVVINENGIKCREKNGTGGYLNEQLWIVNNMLAITDNAWESPKIAIGKINDSVYGDVWGVIGEIIVGKVIAGNNLTITNTNNQFLVDETGATLTNAKFTLTTDNNKGRIILDPTSGIKIQGNQTGTFTDNFYVDTAGIINAVGIKISGNSTFAGALSGATGTFSGSLSAATGTFTGALSGGSINIGSGQFIVDSSGNMTANKGTFKGTLSGATGTFSGSITVTGGSGISNFSDAGAVVSLDQITGTYIANGAITTEKISVGSLSSISANIGSITAGTISGVSIYSSLFASSVFSGYDGLHGQFSQYMNLNNDSMSWYRNYTNGISNVYTITVPRGGSRDSTLSIYSPTSIELDSQYVRYNGSEIATKSYVSSVLPSMSNYYTKTESLSLFSLLTSGAEISLYAIMRGTGGNLQISYINATDTGLAVKMTNGTVKLLVWD